MKKTILATLLLSICGLASADVKNTYDFVDVGYTGVTYDEVDLTLNGFVIEASKLISENAFVTGQWSSVDDSGIETGLAYDINIDQFRLSIGYRHGIAPSTDLYGQLGYVREKYNENLEFQGIPYSESDSNDGYLLKVGLKHSFGRFEGGIFAEHLDGGGSEVDATTLIGVDARIKFTNRFHGVASYAKESDIAIYKIGVSYAF
ncbi:outer membrane beta-barrel protein [Alishewanella tabrizica]|uniref:Outer membrane protein beta-barrel domain-containing protein n=1 Tax=Alishewanella tabrizica TaxID=671278 RepID=A0ABQ2WFT3_9ALTE|nr:outer membrane beta-barrel protein [Alishewanella tabrizica]GGW52689.1 hypothetical protein GCM10008111_05940 [Alishewanella tabrizica]